MKPKTVAKNLYIFGLIVVLFPAIILAGGKEERTFCVTNATEGDNPVATCYKTVLHYGLKANGIMLMTKDNKYAMSPFINRGGCRCVTPYFNVDQSVTIWLNVKECVEQGYKEYKGGKYPICTKHSTKEYEFSVGKLSSQITSYKLTQDCEFQRE